ncbi:MAG: peptide chain release factor 1 [Deltaproteobacteria bacterium]|nr:peptide chain release factor 1 [Deltaproteobacteria bacterium]
MWDKLAQVEERYEELAEKLSSPETIKDRALFQKLSKEHKDLTEVVATFRAYRKAKEEMQGSQEIVDAGEDAGLVEAAQEEIHMLKGELEGLEKRMRTLLIPKDPNDDKNVIMEIRAGAGGDEAGIFVGDLLRMYTRYIEGRKWKVELMSTSDASAGGFKEVICMVTGPGAYSRLKYEKGVHRVQRVPKTETQGRIHTSTVTVAVLPEAEEVEIQIEQKDLRIDVYRSGGPGGQSVNTTDSAVRITHLPTGVVVAMQDEKSQIKNREKAMRVLRARLYEFKQQQLDAERSADRRSQQGSGDRSEKIRTYNYPQSRVTDHRIGLSLYSLQAIVDGDLDQLIDPMAAHEQAELLQGGSEVEKKVPDEQ